MTLTDVLKKLARFSQGINMAMFFFLLSMIVFLSSLTMIAFGLVFALTFIYVSLGLMTVLVMIMLYITKKAEIYKKILKKGKATVITTALPLKDERVQIAIKETKKDKTHTVYFDKNNNAYPEAMVKEKEADNITLYPMCEMHKGDEVQVTYVIDNGYGILKKDDDSLCLCKTDNLRVDI